METKALAIIVGMIVFIALFITVVLMYNSVIGPFIGRIIPS